MLQKWLYHQNIELSSCSGTVEVLAYPALRPLDTLMAHTAGCYCIAIDPIGRCASNLSHFGWVFSLNVYAFDLKYILLSLGLDSWIDAKT